MRRSNWKQIIEDEEHHILASLFKKQVKKDYETHIVQRLNPLKASRLKKWIERADYRATLRVVNNEDDEIEEETAHDSDED